MPTGNEVLRACETEATSPYPGLRPFQPDDTEYFFGRDEQIGDLVKRLRNSKFLAVIGGSGSGKSSLVLAGAIPRLRAFGLRKSGDFWVPVVCTPGTDHVAGDGPLNRFARAFLAQLREDSGVTEHECVETLRSQGGIARLVEAHGSKLASSDGVDLQKVVPNFLILIDQFEELFHPSNAAGAIAKDCEHLVSRIVEHALGKYRSERVCAGLTMRSEHLNDCPRYPGLSESINAAFYLVKRLSDSELREAIELPAQSFLESAQADWRRAQRRLPAGERKECPLPERVVFNVSLVEHLEKASRDVQEDPFGHADHLPLLQHLLFWIWRAACEEAGDRLIPAEINLVHLRVASMLPLEGGSKQENALTACMENRCNALLRAYPSRKPAWRRIFQDLAVKDPSKGSYTQRRLEFAPLRAALARGGQSQDLPKPELDPLAELLRPWLEPHPYLYWDTGSKSLKVAHETLIRRWSYFQKLVDADARRFESYCDLLDDLAKTEKDKKYLVSGSELANYREAGLEGVLADRRLALRYESLLPLTMRGRELAKFARKARTFLENSIEAEGKVKADAAHKAGLLKAGKWFGAAVLVVLTGIGVGLWNEITLSRKLRNAASAYALAAETDALFKPSLKEADHAHVALGNGVESVRRLKEAGKGWAPADWLIHLFAKPRMESILNMQLMAETRTTATLRRSLTQAVWRGPEVEAAEVKPRNFPCEERKGIFLALNDGGEGDGLYLAQEELTSLTHAKRTRTGQCIDVRTILAIPSHLDPRFGVSQDLSNVILETMTSGQPATNFYTINWYDIGSIGAQLRVTLLSTFNLNKPFDWLAPAKRSEPFTTQLVVGKQSLQLFDIAPSLLSSPDEVTGRELRPRPAGSRDCSPYEPTASAQSGEAGPDVAIWVLDKHLCLLVRSNAGSTSYRASLYRWVPDVSEGQYRPSFPLMDEIVLGSNLPKAFKVDLERGSFAYSVGDKWFAGLYSLHAWEERAQRAHRKELAKKFEVQMPHFVLASTLSNPAPK